MAGPIPATLPTVTGAATDGRNEPGHDGEGRAPRRISGSFSYNAANPPGSLRTREHCAKLRTGLTGNAEQTECFDRASIVPSLGLTEFGDF
jgi:hypothetical protein